MYVLRCHGYFHAPKKQGKSYTNIRMKTKRPKIFLKSRKFFINFFVNIMNLLSVCADFDKSERSFAFLL